MKHEHGGGGSYVSRDPAEKATAAAGTDTLRGSKSPTTQEALGVPKTKNKSTVSTTSPASSTSPTATALKGLDRNTMENSKEETTATKTTAVLPQGKAKKQGTKPKAASKNSKKKDAGKAAAGPTPPDTMSSTAAPASVMPIKPKRPLTAYNFFFQAERAILLGKEPPTDEDIMAQHANTTTAGVKKKRKHRKTHGMIGFQELSRHISSKWKALTEEEIAAYQKKHERDKLRYKKEMEIYNAQVASMGRLVDPNTGSSAEAPTIATTATASKKVGTSSSYNNKGRKTPPQDRDPPAASAEMLGVSSGPVPPRNLRVGNLLPLGAAGYSGHPHPSVYMTDKRMLHLSRQHAAAAAAGGYTLVTPPDRMEGMETTTPAGGGSIKDDAEALLCFHREAKKNTDSDQDSAGSKAAAQEPKKGSLPLKARKLKEGSSPNGVADRRQIIRAPPPSVVLMEQEEAKLRGHAELMAGLPAMPPASGLPAMPPASGRHGLHHGTSVAMASAQHRHDTMLLNEQKRQLRDLEDLLHRKKAQIEFARREIVGRDGGVDAAMAEDGSGDAKASPLVSARAPGGPQKRRLSLPSAMSAADERRALTGYQRGAMFQSTLTPPMSMRQQIPLVPGQQPRMVAPAGPYHDMDEVTMFVDEMGRPIGGGRGGRFNPHMAQQEVFLQGGRAALPPHHHLAAAGGGQFMYPPPEEMGEYGLVHHGMPPPRGHGFGGGGAAAAFYNRTPMGHHLPRPQAATGRAPPAGETAGSMVPEGGHGPGGPVAYRVELVPVYAEDDGTAGAQGNEASTIGAG